jgi:hypothetical protein
MGKNRNLLPSEKPTKILKFTDPEVCKHYICGFCPHELFVNTKSDLGKARNKKTCLVCLFLFSFFFFLRAHSFLFRKLLQGSRRRL